MKPNTIVVPVDESPASVQALQRAVALARQTQARLRIVHVLVNELDLVHAEDDERRWLDRVSAASGAARQEGTADVVYVARAEATAYDGIQAAIEDLRADLVVMGTHGGGLLSASVAEQVARRASCNVMICRKDSLGVWPAAPGTIMVPVDFSDNARRAATHAREIARDDDRLLFLHVVSTPEHPDVTSDEVPAPLQDDPALEKRIVQHVREFLDDSHSDVLALEGEVAATILDQAHARDASLVVMGTRGLKGFARFVIGSVTDRVLRSAEPPVLVVR